MDQHDLIITEADLDNLDPHLHISIPLPTSQNSASNPTQSAGVDGATVGTSSNNQNNNKRAATGSALPRPKRVKANYKPDIAVGGHDDDLTSGESGDEFVNAQEDEDEEEADDGAEEEEEYSDDDDFNVDPLLKERRRPKAKSGAVGAGGAKNGGRSTTFATGPFAVGPGRTASSAMDLPSIDYTHISQALAHQPLATNPSPQTIELMQKLAVAADDESTSPEVRLKNFMEEVKTQLFNISQRVDVIETARFSQIGSLSALQSSFSSLEAKLRSTGIVPAKSPSLPIASTSGTSNAVAGPSALGNPVSEAANAQQAGEMANLVQQHINELSAQVGAGPADFLTGSFSNYGFGTTADHIVGSSQAAIAAAAPVKAKRGRKSNATKKRESTAALEAAANGEEPDVKVKRARKPELSRAVRATMFRLLGLAIATTAKYHGYTSSPELPDFSPTVTFDPITGQRVWRWEWDKTIRQSQYNAAFSMAIQNQVITDKEAGMHPEVPEADWAALEEAVDSAYTNLRRERDAQMDPVKKMKKDEHRKKGKKRGLKEEKAKRRLKAFQEGGVGDISAVGEDGQPTPAMSWINILTSFGSEGESLQDALDTRYMSSEDEIDPADPSWMESDYETLTIGNSSLVGADKTIAVHRPGWRSQKLASALSELDALKPPERAHKRVLAEPREKAPPKDTPHWMISDEWKQKVENLKLEGVARAALADNPKGKGKGKAKQHG